MTIAQIIDATDRFPLGSPRGFVPTDEPVSDTAATPFGLTLRTAPDPGNIALVRGVDGGPVMATEKPTTIHDDGQTEDDFRADLIND